ncbi:patatin-like phospholipase family protein [Antarctobacter heliothermus]|nr:patatin-like phospholipase family protein [Antarctobacter heliothermus]
MPKIPTRRTVLAGLAMTALSACTDRSAVTMSTQSTTQAMARTIPRSMPRSMTAPDPLVRFRFFADAGPDVWERHLQPPKTDGGLCVLALSGGGEDGAFGAGALAGWSAAGTRPDFDMVTGISTGALIAPFAYLGPDHDDALRRIFTQHDAGDIMKLQPLKVPFSDALYDTTPLARLIEAFTPPTFLQAIADRHATGARLFVVTSDLDRSRAVVWNMGEIAQSGQYDLFRAILRASAALPGLFSPVTLTYSVGDATFAETHLDGGVHMQFLAIPQFAYTSTHRKLPGGALYLLINNTLDPAPTTVSRSALAISQHALTTSIRANALAEVNATRSFSRANGIDLHVASVDPESGVVYDPSDRFSSTYMNALYSHGFERGIGRTLWSAS